MHLNFNLTLLLVKFFMKMILIKLHKTNIVLRSFYFILNHR